MSAVLDALKKGPFREPAHVWLYEVRSETGFRSRVQRYADALVCSVWPSRGLWIAGVEMKVSRSDWVRELNNPEKSVALQRCCDFWWVAAPVGVVQLSELPETWGLYEIDGKKVKQTKAAPKLTPEPLHIDFLLSVLRNAAANQARLIEAAAEDGRAQAVDKHSVEALKELERRAKEAERKAHLAEMRAATAAADTKSLSSAIAAFEEIAGLEEGTVARASREFSRSGVLRTIKAAEVLAGRDVPRLAEALRSAARSLDDLSSFAPKEGRQ